MIPQLCGANFEIDVNSPEVLLSQPPEKIQMLTGVYLVFMLASLFTVAFLLDSMKRYEPYRKNTNASKSGITLLVLTLKQLAETNQLLLLAMYVFLGFQQAFIVADFTASFVSCAIGTGSVGYVMMAFGVADALACSINGYLSKFFGRIPLVSCAFIVHVGLLVTFLIWRPHAEDYYLMFVIAILWGLCDSVWQVQINAFCTIIFNGKEEVAFSNFGLWEGVGFIVGYVLSSYVRTRYKIYLLLCILIIGSAGYFAVEHKHKKKTENLTNPKNQQTVSSDA